MRLIWCVVWLLSASLLLACVDSLPDPPALAPHPTSIKATLSLDAPSPAEHLERTPSFNFTQPPVWLEIEKTQEPVRPPDRITLTGLAADSSPPNS